MRYHPLRVAGALGLVAAGRLLSDVRRHRTATGHAAALDRVCRSYGWRYSPEPNRSLPAWWDGPPFDTGDGAAAENVVRGTAGGREFVAFEHVETPGRRGRPPVRWAVVAVPTPAPLPDLEVAPRATGDAEPEGVTFESRYRVRCAEPSLAAAVLDPRTTELLLGSDDVTFRAAGSYLASVEPGVLRPAELVRTVHVLTGVVGNVPPSVWDDLG